MIEQVARESFTRIVATLIRVTGDWTLAEDCAQDALAAALERWPRDGMPANPGGWLMTVARNRAVDVLRRRAVESRKLAEVAMLGDPEPGRPAEIEDDRLRLIFTCCHPALAPESRVALTLRVVAGLPTGEIARAFLTTESAMTRRITRAKTKIHEARITYAVPTGPALAERLPGVLAVLYLLFTRGYATPAADFSGEAIRLARLLAELLPGEPEVPALLALFLLQHSRRDARVDEAGDLVPMDRQDRARWDQPAIAEAVSLLLDLPVTGPYGIQAHIAACHATADTAEDTNWFSIALWYDELFRIQPTPVVAVNRAVAHGFAYGPHEGLKLLAEAGPIDNYPATLAVEADLTRRAGDPARAATLFRQAAAASEGPERRALLTRAEEADSEPR